MGNDIYIITTYTGTVLSRLIKRFSHVPYAHVSISLNPQLKPMYAFGRKYTSTPIFAGLVKENIGEGLYGKKVNTLCRVYKLSLEDEQYSKVVENIEASWAKRNYLKYDAKALIRLKMDRPKYSSDKYVCSNFVAYILESSGVKLFDKEYFAVQPIDFYNCKELEIIYEGLLSEYGYDLTHAFV